MDFHMPNGQIITVTPTSGPNTVTITSPSDTVAVWASATGANGIQDIQIWADQITWITYPNGGTAQSGPGLMGGPSASSPDNSTPGQSGCTERVANQNLTVSHLVGHGIDKRVSFDVFATGLNFSGVKVSTPTVRLQAP
jgi:hypothetical protein